MQKFLIYQNPKSLEFVTKISFVSDEKLAKGANFASDRKLAKGANFASDGNLAKGANFVSDEKLAMVQDLCPTKILQ